MNVRSVLRSTAVIFGLGAVVPALPMGAPLAAPGHGHASAAGTPGKAADVTRTIRVMLRDTAFDRKQISVRPGETVRFILKNEGELLHEFNIGSPHDHAHHQKEMMQMVEMGILTHTGINEAKMQSSHAGAHGAMKHDDPNSVLVKPGETRELIWMFGSGRNLEFACNLPGHYQAGMVGRFKVGAPLK